MFCHVSLKLITINFYMFSPQINGRHCLTTSNATAQSSDAITAVCSEPRQWAVDVNKQFF